MTVYMFGVGLGIGPEQRGGQFVRRAALLSILGLLCAFSFGAATASVWYDELAGPHASPLLMILLVGGAVAITAFATMARMLEDAGPAGRAVAGLVLVAALDDIAAWCVLATVVALSTAAGPGQIAGTVLGAAALALAMFAVGR
jgi:Kef-type K+ transport system membrane component KefB